MDIVSGHIVPHAQARIDPMDTLELPPTCRCNKLQDLPPIVNDWQQEAYCPDCEYYSCGQCGNTRRRDSDMACPFDGEALHLREVPVGPAHRARLSLGQLPALDRAPSHPPFVPTKLADYNPRKRAVKK